MNAKNKRIVDKILKVMKTIDHTGYNYDRNKKIFENMTDKEFDTYMRVLRDGKEVIHLVVPNQKVLLDFNDIEKAGELVNTTFFHQLIMEDMDTGIKFVTPEKYFIGEVPVRRLEQTLEEKMSIPRSDMKIDGMTGQVTGDDRSCSITYPELQAIYANSGDKTLEELAVARAGNLDAYANLKHQLEDMGEANISDVLTENSMARSIKILDVYLATMGYFSNLSDPYNPVKEA